MVPFEYFRKLEEECLSYYRHFTEMNLKEKFDSFVPDRILYEKKWNCKFPPFLGSYDRFFHPFDKIKRPKKIKLLETRPEHCEYWKYLYSTGEVKYVLAGHDEMEYRCCYVLVPEGFVQINPHNGGRCESFFLILNSGKRYLQVGNGVKLIEKGAPAVVIPCWEIEEYVLDDKGFDLFSFVNYFYWHDRYDYDSRGIPLCSYEGARYVSHQKLVDNNITDFFARGHEQDFEESYQSLVKRGYQEV